MRKMDEKEMRDFIAEWKWGTLIAVEGDKPYAVEVAYASDEKYLYCGSMPGGRMARCVKANANVVFKICDSPPDHSSWKAVIIEGKAERMTTKEDHQYFLRLLAKKMGRPEDFFDNVLDHIMKRSEDSNSLKIPLTVIGGRASS
jgi:nitroimidazol reductase NimA-like FMN-containing flavoprotein (pyridoxamine 5'-phosphate oxidase superfamily)